MAGAKENSFKLFLFDIGLLGAMINLKPESILRYDYGTYKGYFAENFVLQELCSYGLDTIVTWSGRTSEYDFKISGAFNRKRIFLIWKITKIFSLSPDTQRLSQHIDIIDI